MEIGATSGASTSAAGVGASKLTDTFDTFLTLLTTQLQHQDPLEPVDSSEFTQQLVMFTGAEQTIATNRNLEALIKLFQTSQSAGAVNYLGKVVEADGDSAALSNGSASWRYDLPVNAAQTTITITDANGSAVFTGNGQITAGSHNFVWDGKSTQGITQPDGIYKIAISSKDTNGQSIATTTSIVGSVDGIETVDDELVLTVGSVKVPLDKVKSVTVDQSASQTDNPA
jgi:flagellar basal-body rod modification protein FlgD